MQYFFSVSLVQTKPHSIMFCTCHFVDIEIRPFFAILPYIINMPVLKRITYWHKLRGNLLSVLTFVQRRHVYHPDKHSGSACQVQQHGKKKSFICLCSLKCHSSPLKPINWGYNGTEFLSVELLMNASKPLCIHWITMRFFFWEKIFHSDLWGQINKRISYIQ